jgi:hypothetical protein
LGNPEHKDWPVRVIHAAEKDAYEEETRG